MFYISIIVLFLLIKASYTLNKILLNVFLHTLKTLPYYYNSIIAIKTALYLHEIAINEYDTQINEVSCYYL